jgi:hypothetical protein
MTNRAYIFANSLVLLSTLGLACDSGGTKDGGIGGPHMCGEVQPCGGNLVGNWNISGACFDPSQVVDPTKLDQAKQSCPGFSYSTSVEASGTANFTATTYENTGTMTVSVTFHFPKSCLAGASCSSLEQALGSSLTSSAPGSSLTCTGAGDCDCTFTESAPQTESGTYTTSGNILTTTPSDGSAASSTPYCVQGSTLHIINLDTTDMTKIVADIVGTK